MSLFNELALDDDWPKFDSPMFALVNPNEVLCPLELKDPIVINANQENIYLPPVMVETNTKHHIRQQLNLHKALSRQRQDRLKARLDRQPTRLQYDIRKPSGKKMTGRERQKELEKQESHQLQLRDQYLNMISVLEHKCNKLREILENIVSTSPEYNAEMIAFLETSELLFDKQDNVVPDVA